MFSIIPLKHRHHFSNFIMLYDCIPAVYKNAYCYNLKSFAFGSPINDIPDYCFAGCMSLSDFSLPEGLKSIGKQAFFNCESLLSMIIPEGIISISQGAFYSCKNLPSVDITIFDDSGVDDVVVDTDAPVDGPSGQIDKENRCKITKFTY